MYTYLCTLTHPHTHKHTHSHTHLHVCKTHKLTLSPSPSLSKHRPFQHSTRASSGSDHHMNLLPPSSPSDLLTTPFSKAAPVPTTPLTTASHTHSHIPPPPGVHVTPRQAATPHSPTPPHKTRCMQRATSERASRSNFRASALDLSPSQAFVSRASTPGHKPTPGSSVTGPYKTTSGECSSSTSTSSSRGIDPFRSSSSSRMQHSSSSSYNQQHCSVMATHNLRHSCHGALVSPPHTQGSLRSSQQDPLRNSCNSLCHSTPTRGFSLNFANSHRSRVPTQ